MIRTGAGISIDPNSFRFLRDDYPATISTQFSGDTSFQAAGSLRRGASWRHRWAWRNDGAHTGGKGITKFLIGHLSQELSGNRARGIECAAGVESPALRAVYLTEGRLDSPEDRAPSLGRRLRPRPLERPLGLVIPPELCEGLGPNERQPRYAQRAIGIRPVLGAESRVGDLEGRLRLAHDEGHLGAGEPELALAERERIAGGWHQGAAVGQRDAAQQLERAGDVRDPCSGDRERRSGPADPHARAEPQCYNRVCWFPPKLFRLCQNSMSLECPK